MELFFSLVLISCIAIGYAHENTFDVTNFGAVGDGNTDSFQAFSEAWKAVCGANGVKATLTIPNGTFLLKPIQFSGPCNSTNVHVQVSGTLLAPNTIGYWGGNNNFWLLFEYINGLVMDGPGSFDGQGSIWWQTARFQIRPVAIRFHGCNGLKLQGFTNMNSPGAHTSINFCNGVSASDLVIIAPGDSPNTDGIDISASRNITIANSFIGTGDDCVAIGGGNSNINIHQVTCGPGHGISIGSLGAGGANETVEDVHVVNCTFNGTTNGARIKTWPGGAGYARNISFEQITLVAVKNPIFIDQNYCIRGHDCRAPKQSAVAISDVRYIGLNGTSACQEAIKLNCSSITNCTNIVMDSINIVSTLPGQPAQAFCANVKGTSTSTSPEIPCLSSRSN